MFIGLCLCLPASAESSEISFSACVGNESLELKSRVNDVESRVIDVESS